MWTVVAVLSVISAGAYLGNENAHYFWDLQSYVEALDSPLPYRDQRTFPFLYPPFAADVFTLARSHLFELMSIGYVAAAAFFLWSYSQLRARRQFEWLFAMTAIGGLGIVSLQSGNLSILLNLGLLGVAYQAALGQRAAINALPLLVAAGALLKPQFAIYLFLTPIVEDSWKTAASKIVTALIGIGVVYGIYIFWRPAEWNEYVQAVTKRALIDKDFAWGPSGFIKHWTASGAVALLAYLVGMVGVTLLAFRAWKRAPGLPRPAVLSLVFIALTFANPRLPLYDLYAAAIALGVAASYASSSPLALVLSLAVNAIPWGIKEFTRTPGAWPWWLQDLQVTHYIGLGWLLLSIPKQGARENDD